MPQNITTIISFVFMTTFLVMIFELFYSIHKKDGIYSFSGTLGSVGTFFITRISTQVIRLFYITTIWGTVNSILETRTLPTTLFYFLLCLIISDFLFYVIHKINHTGIFFTLFHSIHHGDVKFNMSTFLRSSAFQELYGDLITLIPLMIIGFNLETIIECSLILSTYQFLTHSSYIKFPNWAGLFLITPQTHLIHHNQIIKDQCSNFGSMFSIWDKIFATYKTNYEQPFTPGIQGYRQNNALYIQTDPFVNFLKKNTK